MKILEKIKQKASNNSDFGGVTIAFLGDSVTQNCFENYKNADGSCANVFDTRHGYERYFTDILAMLFPSVPVSIIYAGIAGDNARGGAARVERDVLRHAPDLTVVCYGLNDCGDSEKYIERYVNALSQIFDRIRESGSEAIFLTPNMLNTEISPDFPGRELAEYARATMERQTSGLFDAYIGAAKELCREKDVPVCDCYAIWRAFYDGGVNTTALLSNKINHPTREMHQIFAYELVKTIFTA